MKIAIIGTGNVGGALAAKWANKGHAINLGVRDTQNFKGIELLNNPNTKVHDIQDAGFANCYSVGGNDRFELMEQFAWFWINLAMVQGQGRDIGFKLLKR